jgi:hypothetical protein
MRATALAGIVVITAVIVRFLAEVAHGMTASRTLARPLTGVAYLVGLLLGRWPSRIRVPG